MLSDVREHDFSKLQTTIYGQDSENYVTVKNSDNRFTPLIVHCPLPLIDRRRSIRSNL